MVDMDQTLIESVGEGAPRYNESLGKILTYNTTTDINGITVSIPVTLKVSIRPNAVNMVKSIVDNGHTFILWSAGAHDYVHTVMRYFNSVSGVEPTVIYTRLDMVPYKGNMYKSMISRGFSLEEFIILEDNPMLVHPDERSRVVKVIPWVFESNDDMEMNWVSQLFKMYSACCNNKNVRSVRLVPVNI